MEKPDFSEWKQHQLWTLVEAACLLGGIEPMPAEEFNRNRKTGGTPAAIYADMKDAIDLKELDFVETRDGFIQGRRVKPDECVTWAVGRGYPLPAEFLDLKRRDPNETPQQRAVRLRRWVDDEKSKANPAFLKSVAAAEGISIARLKQIIYSDKKTVSAKISSPASNPTTLATSSSKPTSPKRGTKD
jgi:hypothetical protein